MNEKIYGIECSAPPQPQPNNGQLQPLFLFPEISPLEVKANKNQDKKTNGNPSNTSGENVSPDDGLFQPLDGTITSGDEQQ